MEEVKIKILFENEEVMHCYLCSGVLHGLSKTFNGDSALVHVSNYRNGVACGVSWQMTKGKRLFRVGLN